MPLRLASGVHGINLSVSIRYHVVETVDPERGPWDAIVVGYIYDYDVLDRSGRELVAYHWHPETLGPGFPHLHVSGRVGKLPVGGDVPPIALGGMHFPTGRIAFESIVRLLIAEFGVAPRRDDWAQVLAGVAS